MEKEPGPRIIIDNRERNGELIKAIESKGIGIEFRTAHVGDYIISDRVCIERKTVADLESCLISGRLFDQIKRLKENYEFPILVLEGDVDYFRLRNNVINGAIAALYIDYGVMMLHTSDAESTGLVIASMAKHEYENDIREPSLKGGARAHTQDQFQEFIVGNIPGVGPKLARSLLAHFKSIRNIANADKSELVKVEKIGKKKADAIHSTLNALYKG
jgi:ERCC4-type nuclease